MYNFNKLEDTDKNKINHCNIIKRILEIIEERERFRSSTEFDHVYSHIDMKSKGIDKEKWKKKIEKKKKEVGYMWKMYVHGNKKANKLAAKGMEKFYIQEVVLISTNEFALFKKDKILEKNHSDTLKENLTKNKNIKEI